VPQATASGKKVDAAASLKIINEQENQKLNNKSFASPARPPFFSG
jgi:hypothetical protein